jgi:hypothetical protein
MEIDGEMAVCIELLEWPLFNKHIELPYRKDARNPSPIFLTPSNDQWEQSLTKIMTAVDGDLWQWLGPIQSTSIAMIVAIRANKLELDKLQNVFGCTSTHVWIPLCQLETADHAELAAAANRLRIWLQGDFNSRFISSEEVVEVTDEDTRGTKPPLVVLS